MSVNHNGPIDILFIQILLHLFLLSSIRLMLKTD